MRVKHHHNCHMCNRLTTCFTFSDYTMLFSICRSCYDVLVSSMDSYETMIEACSFCEDETLVKEVSGFDDSLFPSSLFVCEDCYAEIVGAIELETNRPI